MFICKNCKHAEFELTAKTKKPARHGKGKCLAKFDIPDISKYKVPAMFVINIVVKENNIPQDKINNDEWMAYDTKTYPIECEYFEKI